MEQLNTTRAQLTLRDILKPKQHAPGSESTEDEKENVEVKE